MQQRDRAWAEHHTGKHLICICTKLRKTRKISSLSEHIPDAVSGWRMASIPQIGFSKCKLTYCNKSGKITVYILFLYISGKERLVFGMPFEIVRNDITNMCVDAIVNSANPRPVVGLGTDSSTHKKAGPELLIARQKIGSIAMGQAAITPAFRLHAKYVIHTVGPVWDGGSYGEESLLRSCYDQSLKLALEHDCKSIAFPMIATNNYGFPKDKALQIAVAAFSEFLLEHEMLIYLVVFDRGAYRLSEKLFHSIASYIDDHYVDLWEESTYGGTKEYRQQTIRRRRDRDLFRKSSVCGATSSTRKSA